MAGDLAARTVGDAAEDASLNTVIVGHNLNLRAAANVFIDEGGIALFEPLGGRGFRHLGSLRPEDL
jgi:hypothetical protein